MTEQQWRIVAELIHEAETACEPALKERLALAVQELNIPASVVDRIQRSVITAIARACQDERTHVAGVRILTRAVQAAGERSARSWGFFLVERGTGGGALYLIEAFVYPDGS